MAQFTLPGGVRIRVPRSRGPVTRGGMTRENPDRVCPNLVQWVKPLFNEYPQMDLMRVQLSRLAMMEIPLFADENFTPYFHKSYTQMSPQELDSIFRQKFIVCDQSSYRTQLPGVEYAFQIRATSSPLSYTRLPASIAALQQARQNIARQVQAFQALSASVQSYDSLLASKAATAPNLSLVWPSERKAFQEAFTATQARLAPAALTNKVEALLAAPPSLGALRAMREAPSRYRDLFSEVPPNEAESLRGRLDARSTQIGTALLAEQRKAMLSFPGTRDGLQQGAEWLRQFDTVYVRELKVPDATEVAGDYEGIRRKQLIALEPALRASIRAAGSEDALEPLLEEAYPLPSDRNTPEYARMQQVVAQRAAVFEKEQARDDAIRQREEAAREARLTGSRAQSAPGRGVVQPSAGEPEHHVGFTAHGLGSEAVFNAIYRGEFDKVEFGRDDLKFAALAGGYMTSYWDQCSRFLTADRANITRRECTGGYSHMVNLRTGMQVSPDTCEGWSDVPTERFADRRLYNAVKATEGQQEKAMVGSIIKNVDGAKSLSDIFTGPMNMAAAATKFDNDVASLIQANGCTSPDLMHFQSNLLLFALGKQGMRPDGSRVEYAATQGASAGRPFKDSNYRRLLEDMVSDQAGSWAFNKYVPNSISSVAVTNAT